MPLAEHRQSLDKTFWDDVKRLLAREATKLLHQKISELWLFSTLCFVNCLTLPPAPTPIFWLTKSAATRCSSIPCLSRRIATPPSFANSTSRCDRGTGSLSLVFRRVLTNRCVCFSSAGRHPRHAHARRPRQRFVADEQVHWLAGMVSLSFGLGETRLILVLYDSDWLTVSTMSRAQIASLLMVCFRCFLSSCRFC